MSQQDLFEGILRSLHAAVLDDGRWPATSALIDEACGSKGNTLVSGDGASQDDINIFFARICYRGQRHPELERQYFEVYHAVDERLPRLRQLPDSLVVPTSSLYTNEEMKTSVVYNEVLPGNDSRDGFNVRLDGPDGSRIVWTVSRSGRGRRMVLRPGGDNPASPAPPARSSCGSAMTLADASGAGRVGRPDCSTMSGPVSFSWTAALDVVAAVNDRARALLRTGDGLSDRGGFCCAPRCRKRMRNSRGLLARALPLPRRSGSGRLDDGEPPAFACRGW